jgi:protein arginine phosphatase
MFRAGDYDEQIRRAAETLRAGGVVVLPTETVYGAAGLLSKPQAVQRLKAFRPEASGKPLTVHLADRRGAEAFLGPMTDLGRRMINKLWPGPVALVFEVPESRRKEVAARNGVAESEIYDGSTITLRCPDHIVASDVLAEAGGVVVAVRAGVGSNQVATRGDQVAKDLDGKVDLILDAGQLKYNKPSTIVRVKETTYDIVREGVYDARIIERLLKTTILFVCSGNTCRSPMAEAIAKHVLAEKLHVPESELEKKGINVMSAGAMAMPGSRATPQAVDALRTMGVDLSRHRSRPLTVELVHQADMIYTMGRNHAMAVMSLVPSAADKVTTLARDREIDDPIGSDLGVYQELAGELQTLIQDRLNDKEMAKVLP